MGFERKSCPPAKGGWPTPATPPVIHAGPAEGGRRLSLSACYGATGGWRPETGGWRAGDGLPLIFDAGFLAQIVIPAHQLVFMAHLVLIEPLKKLS